MAQRVDLTVLERQLFHWTREAAHAAGCCIRCGRFVDTATFSEEDRLEYGISAFCPSCYGTVMEDCGVSRVIPGLWVVRVVFEWAGELVHSYTDPVPYDDAARDCFAFGLGIPYWHGMTPVRVLRARIVAVEEAA